ncbi:YqaA family protein [Nitratireductor basaltis]|uniref:VTT domain-containing protein n=1 Tax=Nitratireductor basaltis TaxID=472175 RepID=A0A084U9E7_9HYPH|nr:YqaA family protein [Nitratireductor basaltis]KFB09583.1 hypothetical protein EL18_00599 [Nitratireductor basaltis]
MNTVLALGSLFLISFAAATILPAQSEAVLAGMYVAGHPLVALVIVASIGNTLGAVVNWILGRAIENYRHKSWFPVSPAALDKASRWYHRWGRWSLLLSWAPLGGDALTVAAGVLREPLWSFTILVAIAKTGRYIVLAALLSGFVG